MPWNKPCTLVRRAMGSYTTATVACSMSPSVTPNALAESGIESSVGSGGDSYDNALAETIIGLFKTEVIHPRGPWHNLEHVEFATLEWVDWFNNRRIHSNPLETSHPSSSNNSITTNKESKPWWLDSTKTVSEEPGVIQSLSFCHDSILSRNRVSGKSGVIQVSWFVSSSIIFHRSSINQPPHSVKF